MKFFFLFSAKIFFIKYFLKLFSKFCKNFVEKKYFLVNLSWLQ